jgi:hypothetical protein
MVAGRVPTRRSFGADIPNVLASACTVGFVFQSTSTTYKKDVILGLDPRIHAASHGPTLRAAGMI